jgi:glycogen debranching enzyme
MEAERWLARPLGERQRLLATMPFVDPQFMEIVRAPNGWGVFASAGPSYRHAIFGRDSIETAADLCGYNQKLAHDVIITLARLQGTKYDERSEEEPGKIHHEYRALHLADLIVPEESIEIMRSLQSKWGGTGDDAMLYYGSFDATPLFVRLVERYTKHYGNDILTETYRARSGKDETVLHAVLLAADWVAGKVKIREDRLIAYKRLNPSGLENQIWKDSRTSYLFSDGSMPNLDAGIVSAELQGYAYDALLYAASLSDERAGEFKLLASDIQRSTIAKLWLPGLRFFAQGLGVDSNGQERLLDTLTSNGALLLDSRLLADLPKDESHKYVEGIIATIMGPEFRTEAGIRCRATRHAHMPGYADYHGTYAVWPKETFDIAQGLERFGYREKADQLYGDIIHAVRESGEFYEFFYVDLDGKVWYDGTAAMLHFSALNGDREPLPIPEPGQAWTIAAAITASYKLSEKPIPTPQETPVHEHRQTAVV